MKKLLSVLLALTLSSAVLAACGSEAEDTTSATTTAAPTTTTKAPATTTDPAGEPSTGEPTTDEPSVPTIPGVDLTNATCLNNIDGIEARVFAFEQPSEFGGPVGLIYYLQDKTTSVHTAIQDAIKNEEAYAVVMIDDEFFTIEEYANGAPYFRFNVETAGATLISGVSYDIAVLIYSSDNTLLYYTTPEAKISALSTANAPEREALNVTLPEGLTAVTVNADSIAAEGLSAWGDGAAANLFDGNTTGTKIGGGTDGLVTVTFSLDAAATVTYYTLTTGGDTASNSGRNPTAWTLYGEVNGEWVKLSTVAATKTTVTGLEATNSTPYSYKVSAPAECVNYKIEFTTGGQFQMNELELFVG